MVIRTRVTDPKKQATYIKCNMLVKKKRKTKYSPRRDLNPRPLVYKTSALTPELRRRGRV